MTDRTQPFDLGNNIGHSILGSDMDEELKLSIAKILKAAQENGKSSGIYATSGDQAREFSDQGFNMVRRTSAGKDLKLTIDRLLLSLTLSRFQQ